MSTRCPSLSRAMAPVRGQTGNVALDKTQTTFKGIWTFCYAAQLSPERFHKRSTRKADK